MQMHSLPSYHGPPPWLLPSPLPLVGADSQTRTRCFTHRVIEPAGAEAGCMPCLSGLTTAKLLPSMRADAGQGSLEQSKARSAQQKLALMGKFAFLICYRPGGLCCLDLLAVTPSSQLHFHIHTPIPPSCVCAGEAAAGEALPLSQPAKTSWGGLTALAGGGGGGGGSAAVATAPPVVAAGAAEGAGQRPLAGDGGAVAERLRRQMQEVGLFSLALRGSLPLFVVVGPRFAVSQSLACSSLQSAP